MKLKDHDMLQPQLREWISLNANSSSWIMLIVGGILFTQWFLIG